MSDKFLGSSGSNAQLSNGTTTIFGSTIGALNLDPSQPVKTNSVRQLVSSKLDIADINNLQTELDNIVIDPVLLTDKVAPGNPVAGKHILYTSSVDQKLHYLDSGGVDVPFTTGNFLPLAGGQMAGTLDMNSNIISNVSVASGLGLLVNNKLDSGGDQMTGTLDMNSNIISNVSVASGLGLVVNNKLDSAGDQMTGTLDMNSNIISNVSVASGLGLTVDDVSVASGLGLLVNNKLDSAGDQMTGTLDMNSNIISNVSVGLTVDGKLNKSGDQMSGTLDMNSNGITNLKTPVNGYDGVNKSSITALTQSSLINTSDWEERIAPSFQYTDMVWSSQLNIYVAVGTSGVNRVATSNDGIVWVARTASQLNFWNSVTFSPSLTLFCAVATSGTNQIMTSPDGITWTNRNAPSAQTWSAVTWSESLGVFCAISASGIGNKSMTSPDGINWSQFTTGVGGAYVDMAWSPELSLFVCVSLTASIQTSPDGETWTSSTAINSGWRAVAWSSKLGLFCAVAGSGVTRTMISADGFLWLAGTAAEANDWRSIEWSPEAEIFMAGAAGGTNRTMYSKNGVDWVVKTVPITKDWNTITWSPELLRFVAAGTTGNLITSDYVLTTNRMETKLINDLPVMSPKYIGTSDITIFNTNLANNMIPAGVGNLIIPANTTNIGDTYKIYACGFIDTDGNKDFNIDLDIGGVNIATATSVNVDMNGSFFEVVVTVTFRTIGATASVIGCGVARGMKDVDMLAKSVSGSGSVDTTSNNAFSMEFTWADAAIDRTVTIGTFSITYMRGNFNP
jgi:hypothetical protein